MLIDFARTKAKIAALTEPGKVYTLARTATVEPTGHSDDALAAALQATAAALPSLIPGTRVRIVANPRTTRDGLAGVETLIVRTNPSRTRSPTAGASALGWSKPSDPLARRRVHTYPGGGEHHPPEGSRLHAPPLGGSTSSSNPRPRSPQAFTVPRRTQ
ncbi:hypothetical protein AB1285_27455 [Microbacterium sp. NRRL B-14842]|uniref:hypothetical protein n=1 Tax=Microbacterium sp. NRRL B-14842 TaxID=3162881 RepID=UPI003D278112